MGKNIENRDPTSEDEKTKQELDSMRFDLDQIVKSDMNPNNKEWKEMLERDKKNPAKTEKTPEKPEEK